MTVTILMPALSPTMTEGKLVKWHKKEGDKVEAGEVIAEIETDKATMEFEAVDEGVIGKIIVPEGTSNVAVNSPIAVLLEEGESPDDIKEIPDSVAPVAPAPESSIARPEITAATSSAGSKKPDIGGFANNKGERIFASPLARRIAKEKGLDLGAIKGSGPHGRIVKADVENARPGASVAASSSASAAGSKPASSISAKEMADAYGMEYEEIPNSGVRKVIADRLMESKLTIPHFYLTIDCRLDELLKARKKINDEAGKEYRISVNDFVVKALAQALHKYPKANVGWGDEAVLQFKHADVSVAVATEEGLVTPIVKQAETKSLKEISSEIKDLAKRARDGKLRPEEFQGGTITISNLGMYGIQEFSAIINPPQACIVSVGAGEQRPYVENGEIKIGTFMKCTLSCDHRCVDGAVGAEFLNVFRRFVENPVTMLV